MPNEQEQFLNDLNLDESVNPFAHVEQEITGTDVPPAYETIVTDDDEPKPRNRRERRLEARLNAEREAGIELAARLATLTEAQQLRNEPGKYLESLDRLFGVDSPEAREATEILKSALREAKEEAKREALEAVDERVQRESTAVREAENILDSMVEELEDEFDVDLSTDDKARTDFFKLLERMSPKDRDGNILYYADHFAVWEDYQARKQRPADQNARNIASRTMAQGAPATGSNLQADTAERYLRENGII